MRDLTTFPRIVLLLLMSPRKKETPEQPISEATKKSSFFSQFTKKSELNIITSRSSDVSNTNSIATKVSGFFLHDVLWFIIACSSLIATLGFYFTFLQPLLLEKYVEQEIASLDQASDHYQQTLQTVQKAQETIASKTASPDDLTCAESSKYTSSIQDLSNISELNGISTTPEQIINVPRYVIFTDSQVESIHTSFLTKYQSSLQKLEANTLNFSKSVYLAQYRNSYVEFCMKVEESGGELSKLQDACTTQLLRESLASKQLDATSLNQFEDIITAKEKYCNDILALKTGPFTKYNQLRIETIDFVDKISKSSMQPQINITDELKKAETLISDTKLQLSNYANERKSFNGMWYIIGMDLR